MCDYTGINPFRESHLTLDDSPGLCVLFFSPALLCHAHAFLFQSPVGVLMPAPAAPHDPDARVTQYSRDSDLGWVVATLAGHRDTILARWLDAATAQPFHRGRRERAVTDHIPMLFDALTALMSRDAAPTRDATAPLDDPAVHAAAQQHAVARMEQGLRPVDVLTEFRLLRQELWHALRTAIPDSAPTTDIIGAELLVNEVLDGAGALALAALTDRIEGRNAELLARERAAAVQAEAARLRLDERVRQAELVATVGTILTSGSPLPAQLQQCMEAIVQHLDAAFARIWTLHEAEAMLVLRASAGMYTHLDGEHGCIPVGAFKIGRIAARGAPYLSNNVLDDPEVSDPQWARREGMVAFAGYPLLIEGRVVGVVALFARHPLADATLAALRSVADQIALGTVRAESQAREQAALAEARAERARLEGIFVQIPAAICYLDGPEHILAFANPLYLQLVGRGRASLGKSVAEALPEVVAQGFIALLDAVYTTGEPFVGTEVLVRLDRLGNGVLDDASINFVYAATRDATGAIDGILVHAIEVTESVRARRRVEELLREVQDAELRYRTLFEGVGEGILVIDATGRYVDANPAMTALVGYSLEELRAMRLGDLTEGEDSAFTREAHALPDEPRRGNLTLHRKDGAMVPVEGWVTKVALPSGAVYLGTWHDITERVRAEEERQRFIAMVAHELRNPLASLIGYAQIIQRRERYDAKAVETIIAQAKRLERLTLDLRETVLLQSGITSLTRGPVDVRALVYAAAEQAQATTTTHTITVTLPPVLPEADWDADRIAQVLGNLLLNAIKYSPTGGAIRVEVTNQGDAVAIAVTDTGIGIPAEAMLHLFEPFYRATNAREGNARGMGLGLSISKALAEAHRGELRVESTVGRGSSFTIILPYAVSPAP